MRKLALLGLFVVSACWAQEPTPNSQQQPSQVQAPAPVASQQQTITIPAGTRIPLALASPITSKSTRPGSPVRAVTTFPVTVGNQMAIPVGTYVEGVIDKATKGGSSGPGLLMHFTRILYANGYSVPVDADNTQARALNPKAGSPGASAFAGESEANYARAAQQLSALSPPPNPGPNIGKMAGIAFGVTAAAIIAIAILGHRQGGGNRVLFDTGWQFEMVLQSPLSVDAASVAAAVAAPGAQQ